MDWIQIPLPMSARCRQHETFGGSIGSLKQVVRSHGKQPELRLALRIGMLIHEVADLVVFRLPHSRLATCPRTMNIETDKSRCQGNMPTTQFSSNGAYYQYRVTCNIAMRLERHGPFFWYWVPSAKASSKRRSSPATSG